MTVKALKDKLNYFRMSLRGYKGLEVFMRGAKGADEDTVQYSDECYHVHTHTHTLNIMTEYISLNYLYKNEQR